MSNLTKGKGGAKHIDSHQFVTTSSNGKFKFTNTFIFHIAWSKFSPTFLFNTEINLFEFSFFYFLRKKDIFFSMIHTKTYAFFIMCIQYRVIYKYIYITILPVYQTYISMCKQIDFVKVNGVPFVSFLILLLWNTFFSFFFFAFCLSRDIYLSFKSFTI